MGGECADCRKSLSRVIASRQWQKHRREWGQPHRPSHIPGASRNPGKSVLAEDAGEQVDFAVTRVFDLIAVDCGEEGRELECVEDADGERLMFRSADEEGKACVVKLLEHFANAGIDGIVRPAFAVIAGAVVAGQGKARFFGSVRKQFDNPLFDGRADEPVEGAEVAHVAVVEYLAQAAENAGFRVGEGSVEVEDEGRSGKGHGLSFADETAPDRQASKPVARLADWLT